MPEYLAPGVYVEEVSFRAKSIEGVSTTTTGFIGPTRYGPIDLEPDILTSLIDFEMAYGDRQQLQFGAARQHNFIWHAARAFFEEGGKRLYVVRTFRPLAAFSPPSSANEYFNPGKTGALFNDGQARRFLSSGGDGAGLLVKARFPGAAGNMRVRVTLSLGQNVLGGDAAQPALGAALANDVVLVAHQASPPASPPAAGDFYLAQPYFSTQKQQQTWRFATPTDSPPLSPPASPAGPIELLSLRPNANPRLSDRVSIVTVNVTTYPVDPHGVTRTWAGLALDPLHERDGTPDSIFDLFGESPSDWAPALGLRVVNSAQATVLPIVVARAGGMDDGIDLLRAFFAQRTDIDLRANLLDPTSTDDDRSFDIVLEGGNDGQRPGASEYEGEADPNTTVKTGLAALEGIDDISIVAAPGATFDYEKTSYTATASTIVSLLISHAQRMRYRIAVIDSGNGQSIAQVRAMRGRIDSTYAAFYYPWVKVMDPVTNQQVYMPPSGFVAGIYARNDINRAVFKAPANEVVNLAIGFEQLLNKAQQDVLNPEGINCFRFFEGRGFRLWGARTATSDPEWKYVNLRRYFAYLEHSIDKGTQWAVFEPNGEALWANVRRTIEDFLLNEWQMGALLGDKPEKAYFVRCDRSTMTQNDLDNGRLVCLIGVAPLRPAEYVIFRIGQWTADAKR